jgi:hypothetical protein
VSKCVETPGFMHKLMLLQRLGTVLQRVWQLCASAMNAAHAVRNVTPAVWFKGGFEGQADHLSAGPAASRVVEPVSFHHLGPSRHKVMHKNPVAVILRIDLAIRPQMRV